MSHFEFDFNEDGSISAIHKDGKPYEGGISLESPNSIARTYFEIAIRELAAMKAETTRTMMARKTVATACKLSS